MTPVDPRFDPRIEGWMEAALAQARVAGGRGDVPVGAVGVVDGQVVAAAGNERQLRDDPLAHAEMLVLEQMATQLGTWRFDDATLVVTLEPCLMCAGAMSQARVGRLVYGAADLKAGACGSLYNVCVDPRLPHEIQVVSGVAATECAAVLSAFFADRRRSQGPSTRRNGT